MSGIICSFTDSWIGGARAVLSAVLPFCWELQVWMGPTGGQQWLANLTAAQAWLPGRLGRWNHTVFTIPVFLSYILYQSPFSRFLFNHKIRRIPTSTLLLKAIDPPIQSPWLMGHVASSHSLPALNASHRRHSPPNFF